MQSRVLDKGTARAPEHKLTSEEVNRMKEYLLAEECGRTSNKCDGKWTWTHSTDTSWNELVMYSFDEDVDDLSDHMEESVFLHRSADQTCKAHAR